MIVEHLHVETNALLGGKSIHVAADRIHLPGNFLCGAMLGSFENHVLNEMRNTVPLQVLIPRTSFDPDTNGDRSNMLHLFRENSQTVGQNFAMNIAFLFNHISFPTDCERRIVPQVLLHTPPTHANQ